MRSGLPMFAISERALIAILDAIKTTPEHTSAERLAERARYAPITAKRAIKELENQGAIRVIRSGPPHPNSYEIDPDRVQELGLL